MIVSGRGHAGQFLELLGSGQEFGVHLSYEVQEKPGGIAEALSLCENFAGNDNVMVILGDNIFEDCFDGVVMQYDSGAWIFVTTSQYPQNYGVVEVKDGKIISIEEKPKDPKSNVIQTGLYIYDHRVWNIIRGLKPSHRGELEITDVNNEYVRRGQILYSYLSGNWLDAGTIESLADASEWVRRSWKGRNDIPILMKN